jgi:2-oxoglutarate ferredoxin oxidoreductase subunit alpha
LILDRAHNCRRILVVEANLGQYMREVERVIKNKTVDFFGRMNGAMISPAQIKEALHG